MYKFKLLLIILIAIVGAYLIYNHFDKIRQEESEIDTFLTEYTLINGEHVFEYSTSDQVIELLENGSGILFMCTPESDWCQRYALYLNNTLKPLIDYKVNYFNIKNIRQMNTTKYRRILEILDDYLYKDDLNQSKITMPDLTFIKNGVIIAHDNETSIVTSDNKPEEYWTQDKIFEFENKIRNNLELLKGDE